MATLSIHHATSQPLSAVMVGFGAGGARDPPHYTAEHARRMCSGRAISKGGRHTSALRLGPSVSVAQEKHANTSDSPSMNRDCLEPCRVEHCIPEIRGALSVQRDGGDGVGVEACNGCHGGDARCPSPVCARAAQARWGFVLATPSSTFCAARRDWLRANLMFSSDGRARTAADEALHGAGGGGSDAMLSGDGLGHACVSLCGAWPLSWLVGRHHGCATSGFERAEVGEVQRSKGPWSPEHAGCGVRSWSCRRLDAFRASWRPRGAGLSVLA
jgi:hypothetical protein